jgi:hypothetical protein
MLAPKACGGIQSQVRRRHKRIGAAERRGRLQADLETDLLAAVGLIEGQSRFKA